MGQTETTPLSGRTVEIAGRQVHLLEQPGTGPLVLLLGGCGVAASYWTEVIRLLPDVALAAVDRPGLGGTRWPGTVPMLAEEVATLRELIGQRGGPAILVGHSMASFHIEGLWRQYPDLLAGAVMVDGSAEWPTRRPRTPGPQLAAGIQRLSRLNPVGWAGGVLHRFGASLQARRGDRVLGYERFRTEYSRPDALAMAMAEYVGYRSQAWDLSLLRSRFPLTPRPALVLTALRSPEPGSERKQQRLARVLGGRQIRVQDSRHMMMVDRPQLIADAVRSLRPAAEEAPVHDPLADPPRGDADAG